jgi:hypothetical protein
MAMPKHLAAGHILPHRGPDCPVTCPLDGGMVGPVWPVQTKRLTKASAFSATSRQPLSIVSE